VGREIVTLFGPSGAGKTTLLRLVAGLDRPARGEIRVDGTPVYASADRPGGARWVPAHRRPVGMVFQQPALFPHLTVRENVLFGSGDREAAAEAAELLAMVRLAGLEDRFPGELSGGQQQRVALARALLRRPAALLLDEPFSGLDSNMKEQLLLDVHALQRARGLAVLYITHDLRDACSLGDRMAVIADGEIAQVGSPLEVIRRPVGLDVARFVGTRNLLPGRVSGREGDLLRLRLRGGAELLAAPGDGLAAGDRIVACVRPEAVDLVDPGAAETPAGPPAGAGLLQGRIVLERLRGATSTLTFELEGDETGGGTSPLRVEVEVPVRSYEALGIGRRARWLLRIRPSVVHLLPLAGGATQDARDAM